MLQLPRCTELATLLPPTCVDVAVFALLTNAVLAHVLAADRCDGSTDAVVALRCEEALSSHAHEEAEETPCGA